MVGTYVYDGFLLQTLKIWRGLKNDFNIILIPILGIKQETPWDMDKMFFRDHD